MKILVYNLIILAIFLILKAVIHALRENKEQIGDLKNSLKKPTSRDYSGGLDYWNDSDSEIKELILLNDPICSKHHF